MIYQMNKPKTDAVETTRAESRSISFEALFAEHWPHVFRVLSRLVGDPVEAQDLALETFFRYYQHNLSLEKDFNHGGWLHRVAVNLGLHSIRSFKRREHYEMEAGKIILDEAAEIRPARFWHRRRNET